MHGRLSRNPAVSSQVLLLPVTAKPESMGTMLLRSGIVTVHNENRGGGEDLERPMGGKKRDFILEEAAPPTVRGVFVTSKDWARSERERTLGGPLPLEGNFQARETHLPVGP